jgi:hypothetical protein
MESTEIPNNVNKVPHMIAHYVTLENMYCCKVALVQVVRHQTVSHENINILPYSLALIKYKHPNHQDSWIF